MNTHERRSPDHPLRRSKDYDAEGNRVRRWSNPERAVRLSYRSRPLITLAATVLAVILPATLVVGATNIGSSPKTQVSEGKRDINGDLTWSWSDTGTDLNRVFESSTYSGEKKLPTMKVSVGPDQTGLVYLEFEQEGDWNPEWVARPDANGNATIPIDPYCADESWCDGEYHYRLKMPGLVSYVEIDYWDR